MKRPFFMIMAILIVSPQQSFAQLNFRGFIKGHVQQELGRMESTLPQIGGRIRQEFNSPWGQPGNPQHRILPTWPDQGIPHSPGHTILPIETFPPRVTPQVPSCQRPHMPGHRILPVESVYPGNFPGAQRTPISDSTPSESANSDSTENEKQTEPSIDELTPVAAGESVTLEGEFGEKRGAVAIRIGGMLLEATVTEWSAEQVVATIPTMPLANKAKATVLVLTAESEIAESIDIVLTPATEKTAQNNNEEERARVSVGQELTLEGTFGASRGEVKVIVGETTLSAEVLSWKTSEATIRMPSIPLVETTPAELVIVDSAGNSIESLAIFFEPKNS